MKQAVYLTLLAGLFVLFNSVCAEESTSIHVDIDSIEGPADVTPVDGIRSAGQPDEQALAVFVDAGYVAVIDFRGDGEDRGMDEAAVAKRLGLTYIALPIASPVAVNFENAQKLEQILDDLDGPALLHCGSGNRVGALLALMKSGQGMSDQAAMEYGASAGLTGLAPVVKTRLSEKD